MNYKIESFCDNSDNANTYLIYNDLECVIVDPANNDNILKKYMGERKIVGILLTHGHYDHFKTLNKLLDNDSLIYMHKNAYTKLLDVNMSYAKAFGCNECLELPLDKLKFVVMNEKINLGSFIVKCLYTPGHTDCMMSYLIDDNLFSGDFLFKHTIGRTDLVTGSLIRMQNSLREIKKIKNNLRIYPGHGDVTTLEEELKNNHYFKKLV